MRAAPPVKKTASSSSAPARTVSMARATTSPISAASSSRRFAGRGTRAASCRAFTLVEMLVVIWIILVVIGLAAPMIMRAWRSGDRAATYNDLQVIAAGLEAYRTDHGEYPRVTPP